MLILYKLEPDQRQGIVIRAAKPGLTLPVFLIRTQETGVPDLVELSKRLPSTCPECILLVAHTNVSVSVDGRTFREWELMGSVTDTVALTVAVKNVGGFPVAQPMVQGWDPTRPMLVKS